MTATPTPDSQPVAEVVIQLTGTTANPDRRFQLLPFKEMPPAGTNLYTRPPEIEKVVEALREAVSLISRLEQARHLFGHISSAGRAEMVSVINECLAALRSLEAGQGDGGEGAEL